MKNIKRYIRMYPSFVAMAFKASLSYKVDLFLGIIGFLATNVVAFLTLFFTVLSIPSLNGLTLENMTFLYGFCLIPKAIDHVLTDNIWSVGNEYVVRGNLDQYLTKPINPLFHIIATKFQYEGLGELILGIIFLIIYGPKQGINWNFENISALIVVGILASIFFFSIKLMFASVAFWTKRSIELMTHIYDISNYSKYPVEIFHDAIKAVMLYIIPFSLFLYMPISYLYQGKSIWILVPILAGVLAVFLSLAFLLWNKGIKRYESSGS